MRRLIIIIIILFCFLFNLKFLNSAYFFPNNLLEVDIKNQIKERVCLFYIVDENSTKSLDIKVISKFNNKSLKIKEISYLPTGYIFKKVNFKYNSKDNLIKKKILRADNIILESYIWKYNNRNNIIEYIYTSYNPKISSLNKYSYKYDDKWRIIEQLSYSKNDKLVEKITYKYNKKNKIINESSKWQQIIYEYDKKGNLILETKSTLIPLYKTNNIYNKKKKFVDYYQLDSKGNIKYITKKSKKVYQYNT